ncbi:MAG: hypothetical protein KAG43_09265 [Candidatus Marithrix sp.]|nr:hypothetical protein [Candidatus Marithrix sp.]
MNLEPDKNQDFLFVKDELFRDVEEYAQDEGFKHVQELFQNLDDMDEDLFQDFNDTDNVFMPYSPEFFEYHHCNSSILTFAEHYNFGFEEAFRSGFEKAFQDFNNNVQPPEYYDFIFEKYCCQVHKNSLQDFNNTDEITENSTVELSVLVEKTLQN